MLVLGLRVGPAASDACVPFTRLCRVALFGCHCQVCAAHIQSPVVGAWSPSPPSVLHLSAILYPSLLASPLGPLLVIMTSVSSGVSSCSSSSSSHPSCPPCIIIIVVPSPAYSSSLPSCSSSPSPAMSLCSHRASSHPCLATAPSPTAAEDRMFAARMCIKAGDIGHSALPWDLHERWSICCVQEPSCGGPMSPPPRFPRDDAVAPSRAKVFAGHVSWHRAIVGRKAAGPSIGWSRSSVYRCAAPSARRTASMPRRGGVMPHASAAAHTVSQLATRCPLQAGAAHRGHV